MFFYSIKFKLKQSAFIFFAIIYSLILNEKREIRPDDASITLLDNIYARFVKKVYRQAVGIEKSTNYPAFKAVEDQSQ